MDDFSRRLYHYCSGGPRSKLSQILKVAVTGFHVDRRYRSSFLWTGQKNRGGGQNIGRDCTSIANKSLLKGIDWWVEDSGSM